MASILIKIRQKVREGKFILTDHVERKLESLALESSDLNIVLKNGRITETLTHDPRGARYVIIGKASDEIELELVCRFTDDGKVVFVTCYDLY
jgi:hypothetical protein